MGKNEMDKLRAVFALKQIREPLVLEHKLLTEQITMLSNLTAITNDKIGDLIVGVEQVLEIFEWLPKGEYEIKIKIV